MHPEVRRHGGGAKLLGEPRYVQAPARPEEVHPGPAHAALHADALRSGQGHFQGLSRRQVLLIAPSEARAHATHAACEVLRHAGSALMEELNVLSVDFLLQCRRYALADLGEQAARVVVSSAANVHQASSGSEVLLGFRFLHSAKMSTSCRERHVIASP
eukprot:CAMPEP_0115218732 /NCGR_PEP_ID=MMETSP0270-20121206/26547_1 /TAXON_ID=71861 /ORGANISM="Scrippsiella trochoidea, Strain CCMP3099" /LENGTH=158 /DNA_ID=CAMNT_0002632693 /DNA_START=234 /DNA_END=710 /DNA_ORIENTATION=-